MTLEIQSQKLDAIKDNSSATFSMEQLEVLQDEYERKCANEELESIKECELVEHYRTKYRISKRDALDMIARDN